MRSALVLVGLVLVTACTAEAPPSAAPAAPTGPCAAEREQPPEGSQEQRQQGDLDGDGRADEVVSWVRDGERVVQAWLATGENAAPEALFAGDLLSTEDVGGRAQVRAELQPGGEQARFVLEGCRLVPVPASPSPAS